MDHREWRVQLPRTAAAVRRGEDVEAVLEDELCDKGADLVGINGLEYGGWPDDEQVEITEVEVLDSRLVAEVTVSYDEVVSTGCSDIHHYHDRVQSVVVTMEPGSDWAEIESCSEREDWDQADRNSARDGS